MMKATFTARFYFDVPFCIQQFLSPQRYLVRPDLIKLIACISFQNRFFHFYKILLMSRMVSLVYNIKLYSSA